MHDHADSFSAAFASAVRARGVTLSHLHRRLDELATPVSVATLSYWRSGRSEPERRTSLDAVRVLEELLGLQPDELLGRLRHGRRTGPLPREAPVGAIVAADADAAAAALAAVGFTTAHDEFVDDRVFFTFDLDRDGRARRLRVTMAWRAIVEGARRAALVLTTDGSDEAPPELVPLAGCRLGRVHHDPDHHLSVHELLTEVSLNPGETVVVEYEIRFHGSPRLDNDIAYYAFRRIRDFFLWVRFDPDCVPAVVEEFEVPQGGEEVTRSATVTGAASHRVVKSFGPGTAGIRWFW